MAEGAGKRLSPSGLAEDSFPILCCVRLVGGADAARLSMRNTNIALVCRKGSHLRAHRGRLNRGLTFDAWEERTDVLTR